MGEYRVTQTVHNDLWVARRIPNTLQWAVGEIGVDTDRGDEARVELVRQGLDSIVPVPKGEENTANCTDGRRPDVLASTPNANEDSKDFVPGPVRPTLAGASLVAAHYAFESVGVIPDTKWAEEAVYWTAEQMRRVDLVPVADEACVAGDRYATIKENTLKFSTVAGFRHRNKQTYLSDGADHDNYSQSVEDGIIAHHRQQLRRPGYYDDLTPDTFLRVARYVSGDRGVVRYVDDGRGLNGHAEGNILRLNTFGYAVDARALHERGGQSLTVNDDMLRQTAGRLAFILSETRNFRTPIKYAMNMHANTVHATMLAPDVPTWLVQKINASLTGWSRS